MTTRTHQARRKELLDKAFARLQRMLPAPPARALRWLHHPNSRPVRFPLGVLCICGSFFWFLPVLGLELLPIGLLLIAQDIPILQRPVARMTMRLLDLAGKLKRRWKAMAQRYHCKQLLPLALIASLGGCSSAPPGSLERGMGANRITLLRDSDGDGSAEQRSTFVANLASLFGMALAGSDFYVASTDALLRFTYAQGATSLDGSGMTVVDLPAGPINHQWTKNVIASPAP